MKGNVIISMKKYEAPMGECEINIDFTAPVSKGVYAIVLYIKDIPVGEIKKKEVIKSGKYTVKLNLAMLGDGEYEIIAHAHGKKIDEGALMKSDPISVKVHGAGYPPRYFVINEIEPKTTRKSKPEVRAVIQNEKREILKSHRWKVSVQVDGKPLKNKIKVKGGSIRFHVDQKMRNGMHKILYIVSPEDYPKIELRFEHVIFIDTTRPNLKAGAGPLYVNSTRPVIELEAFGKYSGIDPDSLLIYLDQKIVDAQVTANDTGGEPNITKFHVRLINPLWTGKHILKFVVSDKLGNKSRPIQKSVFVDTSAPFITDINPKTNQFVKPPLVITADINNEPLPAFFQRSVSDLRGVDDSLRAAMEIRGYKTIGDIAQTGKRGPFLPDLPYHEVLDIETRAKAIEEFKLDPHKFRGILFWTASKVLDCPVTELKRVTEAGLKDINILKEKLRLLHLYLDHPVFEELYMGELVRTPHSGIAQFKVFIDGEDFSDKATYIKNTGQKKKGKGTFSQLTVPVDDIPEGRHVVEVSISDHAGNECKKTSTFEVDTTPPRVYELTPQPGSWINTDKLVISAKLSDERSGVDPRSVKIAVNNIDKTAQAVIGSDMASLIISNPEERKYTVKINCADKVGNVAHQSEFDFNVDTSPPEILIDQHFDKTATTKETIKISGSILHASPGEIAKILVNGRDALMAPDYTFTADVILKPGLNRIFAHVLSKTGDEDISNAADIYRVTTDSNAFAGVVETVDGKPFGAVLVRDTKTGITAYTNDMGRFVLFNLTEGYRKIEIASPDDIYQGIGIQINPEYGKVFSLSTPIYLLKSCLKEGIEVPVEEGETEITAADDDRLQITLNNRDIRFPDGAERKIGVQLVRADRLPVDAPPQASSGMAASLEPSGLQIETEGGAYISLPNSTGLEAGAAVPLISFNNENGRWGIAGFAKVSDDETRVESLEGMGIRHFSLVAAMPLGPQINILDESNNVPGTDSLKGGFETSVLLPDFTVRGKRHTPELTYSSLTASPSVLLTGVFKGLKEIKGEPQTIVGTMVSSEGGTRVTTVDRELINSPWGPLYRETESPPMFVPDGAESPVSPGVLDFSVDDWGIQVTEARTSTTRFYRLELEVTTTTQATVWPESVTSRYLFSNMDSGEFAIKGELMKKGPEPRPGQPDNRQEFPALPENFCMTYHMEPRHSDGSFLPTGLYSFLAGYKINGRGYQTSTTSTVVKEAYVNPEIPDSEKVRSELLSGIDKLSLKYQYSDPFEYLINNDAGTAIVHNLSSSSLGCGWRLNETQQVYPLGKTHALVVGPEGKHVFTISNTIQELHKKACGAIVLSKDGKTLYAAESPQIHGRYKKSNVMFRITDQPVRMSELPGIRLTTSVNSYYKEYKQVDTKKVPDGWRWSSDIAFWAAVIGAKGGSWEAKVLILRGGDVQVFKDEPVMEWESSYHSAGGSSHTEETPVDIAGIAAADDGSIYVSDRNTCRIFKIHPTGNYTVIAGRIVSESSSTSEESQSGWTRYKTVRTVSGERVVKGFTPDGQAFKDAPLNRPGGLALDAQGNLLFAEEDSNLVRKLNFKTGLMETVAGMPGADYIPNRVPALNAGIPAPLDIALSPAGNLYVLCQLGSGHQAVGRVDKTGCFEHIAGTPPGTGTLDTGINAGLYKIIGASYIAVDDSENLYISISKQNIIVVVRPDGFVDLAAGTGEKGGLPGNDGPALQAVVSNPLGIAATPEGNVILADPGEGSLRLISFAAGDLGETRFENPRGYFDSRLRRCADNTWIRSYKDGTKVFFDAGGKHMASEDKNGNRTTYLYDSRDRLVSVSYPGGGSLELKYSQENGHLESIKDHAGRETIFGNNNGNLSSVLYPDTGTLNFSYDANGRMTKRIDAAGNNSEIAYNEYGRLISQITDGQQFSITRPDDAVSGNAAAQSTELVAKTGSTIFSGQEGKEISVTIENGQLIREIIDFDGGKTKIKYNKDMLPVLIALPSGNSIQMVYNKSGDMTLKKDEFLGAEEVYEYDTQGNLTRTIDAEGRETVLSHDDRGNLIQKRTGSTPIISNYHYDGFGQLTGLEQGGTESNFLYDEKGNVIKISVKGQNDMIQTHDAAGNKLTETMGERHIQFSYNPFNRMINVANSAGTTLYEYGKNGKIARIVDSIGNTRSFQYDSKNNLVQRTDTAGRIWNYEYDDNNRLTARVSPGNSRIEFQYENKNGAINMIARAGEEIDRKEYDGKERLIKAANDAIEITFSYNESGWQTEESFHFPDGNIITFDYQYDRSGKRTAVVPREIGHPINREYSDDGFLSMVTCHQFKVGFVYDAHGRLTKIQQGNGTDTGYSYNSVSHITGIKSTHNENILQDIQLAFDLQGNCVKNSDWTYKHNELGQLIEALSQTASPSSQHYKYDEVANRTEGPNGVNQYDTFNDLLLEDSAWVYSYDEAGRLTQRTSKSDPQERHLFEYSAMGKLVKFSLLDAQKTPRTTVRYYYDPLDRRIGKQVEYRDTPELNSTSWWVYEGENILLEFDQNFNLLRQFVNTGGIDDILGYLEGDSSFYYIKGHLGSVEHISDNNGTVIASYSYDPFGNHREVNDSLSKNRFRYVSREWEEESGLYYNRMRYYDPAVGRFLQPDPDPGKLNEPFSVVNRYVYANNNPVVFTDPRGESWFSENVVGWIKDRLHPKGLIKSYIKDLYEKKFLHFMRYVIAIIALAYLEGKRVSQEWILEEFKKIYAEAVYVLIRADVYASRYDKICGESLLGGILFGGLGLVGGGAYWANKTYKLYNEAMKEIKSWEILGKIVEYQESQSEKS